MEKKEEKDKKVHLAIYTTQDWVDYVQAFADQYNISRSKAGEEIIKEWSEMKNGTTGQEKQLGQTEILHEE